MDSLRLFAPGEELDYTLLMDCLQDYSSPRAKVTRLLKAGDLIRVKKGLYVFGEKQRRNPYSLEILANKIYGPSYISLEYALAYYGLLPEHVFEVTSVCTKRRRSYRTPLGTFSYECLPPPLYRIGFALEEVLNGRTALVATPEKALADLFYTRNYKIENLDDLQALLFEDLRLSQERIACFRVGHLEEIYRAGGSSILALLINWIRRRRCTQQ